MATDCDKLSQIAPTAAAVLYIVSLLEKSNMVSGTCYAAIDLAKSEKRMRNSL